MSSRFFIDFPDIETQTRKLESYLINHFNSDNELEMRYALDKHRLVRIKT